MRSALLLLVVAGLAPFTVGNVLIQRLVRTDVSPIYSNASSPLVAVPFGSLDDVKFSDASLIQTAGTDWDPNVIASDVNWNKYIEKGRWYRCLLSMSDKKAGKELFDPRTPPSAESVWDEDLERTFTTMWQS